MTALRVAVVGLAVSLALVLQVSVLSSFSWQGVAPNLVLLVVVAAGLARGPQVGLVVGFAAGVLLDLVPPADHVAGRWALALLVAGYVAGRVTADGRTSGRAGRVPAVVGVATVAAASFLASSAFALSGVVLRDPPLAVPDLLQVILTGVVLDVLLTPLVLPGVLRLFERLEPEAAV